MCGSRNGQVLRAGLFNGHFLHTLLLVAAPVPVLVGALLLLYAAVPDLAASGTSAKPLTPAEGKPVA